ncbi:MAG: sodium-dependent bicarbonate transport family permease, partial [Roseomonas sp.]|nr:sodium-dependent bicarbonate transport family permease [Roseomonas sp.]
FAIAAPICFGVLGVYAGWAAGLSMGGAFVLGAICASASYIDAPAACRAALPEASPGIYLTASLGVTFPFNLLVNLPLLYALADWLYG